MRHAQPAYALACALTCRGVGRLQIERVRLSARALEGPRPAREQDVLHYQWCASPGFFLWSQCCCTLPGGDRAAAETRSSTL